MTPRRRGRRRRARRPARRPRPPGPAGRGGRGRAGGRASRAVHRRATSAGSAPARARSRAVTACSTSGAGASRRPSASTASERSSRSAPAPPSTSGHGHAGRADRDELGPQVGGEAERLVLTQPLDRARAVGQRTEDVDDRALFVGRVEIHGVVENIRPRPGRAGQGTGRTVRTYVRVRPPPPVATILHADLDAFFASVEQRDDPRLRGRPVIVGGGVVMAASYEARAFGVRGAMGGRQARQLCPHAIVVAPRMSAYTEASRAVFEVFRSTTPLVEGISIDEAFLDVAGLRRVSGAAEQIAAQLRRDVFERVGLRITVGGARTKFLAKVASRVAKPDGLLIVPPAHELEFLHGLAGRPPLGRRARHRAQAPRTRHHHAWARSPASARTRWWPCSDRRRAVTSTRWRTTVTRGPCSPVVGDVRWVRSVRWVEAVAPRPEIAAMLDELLDGVARRLRSARLVGHTVVLRLRFDDFTRVTRSSTLALPTADTEPLRRALHQLLTEAAPDDRRTRSHPGRSSRSPTSPTPTRCSSGFRSTVARASPSIMRSTPCATGSAARRSGGPRCSAVPADGRCRCSPTTSARAAPRLGRMTDKTFFSDDDWKAALRERRSSSPWRWSRWPSTARSR